MISIGIYLFIISLTGQDMLYAMSLFRHQFHITQNQFLNLKMLQMLVLTTTPTTPNIPHPRKHSPEANFYVKTGVLNSWICCIYTLLAFGVALWSVFKRAWNIFLAKSMHWILPNCRQEFAFKQDFLFGNHNYLYHKRKHERKLRIVFTFTVLHHLTLRCMLEQKASLKWTFPTK